MTLRRLSFLAAAVPLMLVSCGRAQGSPAGEPSPPPDGSLVVRIDRAGGIAGPTVGIGRIPALSAYADGRLITPGPQIAVYPAPALPSVQVHHLDADAVDDLAERAVTAGVRTGTDFGDPRVTDAMTTTVTAVTGAGVHRVAVTALGEATPGDTDLTEAQRAARAELRDFVEHASKLPTSPGASDPEPYRASAMALLATPYLPSADRLPSEPPARPWPGPALPGEQLPGRSGFGCAVVTGAAADQLRAAAADASVRTPWRSGDATWSVTFRPLLPDEQGCADLARGGRG